MKIITDENKINELLDRSVLEVIEKESLRKKLLSGKKLKIKLGIDPTSPNLHLGRAIPLLKLKDFQDLGHEIILIFGDFTGTIGDTSDKESERPMLDKKTVIKNMKTYKKQAGKILNMSRVKIFRNSKWLNKLGYEEIGKQADSFSVNEFLQRDLIKKRLKAGSRISLREFLYPLMQGYDSVKLKADVEIGGSDQKFNILAGRTLQKTYNQQPQSVILLGPLLEGNDGRKMSSSWGNTINLLDSPDIMFGKVMSINDNLIEKYFIHTTRITKQEYTEILKKGPRDAKLQLAEEIVKKYHDEEKAKKSKENWIKQFSKKEIPDNLETFKIKKNEMVLDVLLRAGIINSKKEGKRKISEKAVQIDGKKITDNFYKLSGKEKIIKLGRKMITLKF